MILFPTLAVHNNLEFRFVRIVDSLLSLITMLSLCASYDGRPVSVLLDPSSKQSLLSSQFALTSNVPRTISFQSGAAELWARGPIRIPTSSGWFDSRLPLLISYVQNHDVVLGHDWFAGTHAVVDNAFVRDPSEPSVPLSDGHSWTVSPFLPDGHHLSDTLPITGGTAVESVLSPDGGSEASSSRGPGSIQQVARAEMPYNIAYAVSVIVPVLESQSVFRPQAPVEFVRSMCASHGIVHNDVGELQRVLLLHILSGECASHAVHQQRGGCLQIAGVFESSVALRESIHQAVAARFLIVLCPLSSGSVNFSV
ncbi:hypothetical protein C2E23DRAFT_224940 [Lenzites betulinus]|nr:hypothetical protein C2E23DRAFT_224940 [Lenzites betulinus]